MLIFRYKLIFFTIGTVPNKMYKILLGFFIGIFFQACLMAEEIAGGKDYLFLPISLENSV